MPRSMEAQLQAMRAQMDRIEAEAHKSGQAVIHRLEQKVLELQTKLNDEQRGRLWMDESMRKTERQAKELQLQSDQNRKNQERMQDLINQLQQKCNTYQRQIKEADNLAAVNLAKFQKVQQELEDAENRANMAENVVVKLRAQYGS